MQHYNDSSEREKNKKNNIKIITNKENYEIINTTPKITETRNLNTTDNLFTQDNQAKKSEDLLNSTPAFIKKLEKNTIFNSETKSQYLQFKNNENKEDFYDKLDEYNNIKPGGIISDDMNINERGKIVSLKITNLERKSMKERVFWTKEKMEKIRIKFRMAKEKIKKKTELDFLDLFTAISDGNRDKIL